MSAPRTGLVAVLFTDLVGSTELMSQLGDRAFDELRRQHFAALGKAVAAHGGEEVKNTGDGLMAVFPSAAEAVEAAVVMQQATARQAKTSPLAIRVGVAVGDATLESGDYFGTPVVEAARLVGAARPGQILTTAVVRTLAGSRCTAAFIDHDPLTVKGLPDPLAVCEVAWEPLVESSIPLPALLTDMGRIFVGRDTELERLGQLWKEAAAGERRVALLAGEPGVGKTRLAAEIATQAHEQGATILAGRCGEDLGVPYQPFVEALRHFVDHTPVEELAARLGRYAGELVRLVPDLADRAPVLPPPIRSDPETERYRLFDAVAAWLAAATIDEPLLLVLDDLQWAAKPTLLLLRHVVRFPELSRVLVVGTYRDSELAHGHPLVEVLADLRRYGVVERLSLRGLDSSAVAAFMEQAAGHSLDDEDMVLAAAIYEETQGNPFFVREVLRHLTETGALQRPEGHWAGRLRVEEVGIPEGVREVVGRRLSHLSQEANQTLRVAAVVGLEFELSVIQAAETLEEEGLVAALEEASEAHLVIETPGPPLRYRFAHALVRDTLYDGLSAARRVTVHRRVAEAIEVVHASRLDDYLPALAHHWARASVPAADTVRAVEYVTRAGNRALALLAHDEAVAYYRQALDLLEAAGETTGEARRVDLLIALGEAQRRAWDPAHRETLLEAGRLAQARGNAGALTRAALANSGGSFSTAGGVDEERVAMLQAALGAAGGEDSAVRAQLLATLALELAWVPDKDRRRQLSDEAVTLARATGQPATLLSVLTARLMALWDPTTLAERLAAAGEVLALVEQVQDPSLRFWGYFRATVPFMEQGDLLKADACVAACVELATDLGQPVLRWYAWTLRATRVLIAGRLTEAAEMAQAAFEIGQVARPKDASLFYLFQLFGVRFEQGRLGKIEEQIDNGARVIPMPLVHPLSVLLLCELGRDEEATAASVRAADLRMVPLDIAWMHTMAIYASVAAHLGDRTAAAALREMLSPFADQVVAHSVIGLGAVSHFLGMLATTLGYHDEADARFAEAAETHARLAAPAWLARTRLEWTRMLLTRRQAGDAERARELLDQALATARELGLGNVERRAVALLGELE